MHIEAPPDWRITDGCDCRCSCGVSFALCQEHYWHQVTPDLVILDCRDTICAVTFPLTSFPVGPMGAKCIELDLDSWEHVNDLSCF